MITKVEFYHDLGGIYYLHKCIMAEMAKGWAVRTMTTEVTTTHTVWGAIVVYERDVLTQLRGEIHDT